MAARASAGLSRFNLATLALGLAFLYLPIVILVIYSFNASRLVTVWGGWSTRWYTEFFNDAGDACGGLDEFSGRGGVGDRGDHSRHAGGDRAGARRPVQGPRRCFLECCTRRW